LLLAGSIASSKANDFIEDFALPFAKAQNHFFPATKQANALVELQFNCGYIADWSIFELTPLAADNPYEVSPGITSTDTYYFNFCTTINAADYCPNLTN
jgi:hypothetical protein